MTGPLEPLDVRRDDLERLVERAEAGPLGAADVALLRAVIQTLSHVADLLAAHGTTLADLRRVLLAQPTTTEKTSKVLERAGLTSQSSSEASAGGATAQTGVAREGMAVTGRRRLLTPHES